MGVGRKVILRPAVQKRYVELSEPSLSDQTTDLERVLAAVDDLELRCELSVLKNLGRVLRANDYCVTLVISDDLLIGVEPADTTERLYAIAFDLGTTTVVATLLDLSTGAPLAVQSMLNQQQPFGADVITRISAIMMNPAALEEFTRLAHRTLDDLARRSAKSGVEPHEVYEIALAGNATMTHIVLGIDPESLGVAPFIMTATLFPDVLASDVGVVVHERARAVIFPCSAPTWVATLWRACWLRAWTATRGCGSSSISARTASWCSATAIACSPRRRPPGPPLRGPLFDAECVRRRVPSRW